MTDDLCRDVLVDIATSDECRFGTGGKMLKPSRASVEAAIATVPRGATMTVTELRQRLARQHGADTACPFATKHALMAIAEDPAATAPYWRIVKPNGTMMTYFPGGATAQTQRLRAE